MNITVTIFRGIGFGYFRQKIKGINEEEDLFFDLQVVNFIFLFISVGVYKRTNYRM